MTIILNEEEYKQKEQQVKEILKSISTDTLEIILMQTRHELVRRLKQNGR